MATILIEKDTFSEVSVTRIQKDPKATKGHKGPQRATKGHKGPQTATNGHKRPQTAQTAIFYHSTV